MESLQDDVNLQKKALHLCAAITLLRLHFSNGRKYLKWFASSLISQLVSGKLRKVVLEDAPLGQESNTW